LGREMHPFYAFPCLFRTSEMEELHTLASYVTLMIVCSTVYMNFVYLFNEGRPRTFLHSIMPTRNWILQRDYVERCADSLNSMEEFRPINLVGWTVYYSSPTKIMMSS